MFRCLFAMVEQHEIKGIETIRVVLIMKPTFSFYSLCETQNQDGNWLNLERSQSILKSVSLAIWSAFLGNIPLEFFKLYFLAKAEIFISLLSLYELTSLSFEISPIWSFFLLLPFCIFLCVTSALFFPCS